MALFKVILFLQLLATVMSSNVQSNLEKKILDQIFSSLHYDKRIRPRLNSTGTSQNSPVNVTVDMYIISLSFLNEEKQTYNLDIYFRESWLDERLKYDNIINGRTDLVPELTLNTAESLWTPDIFFPNEVNGYSHIVTSPNVFVRITHDGHVFFSLRLNLQVQANYQYQKFPFDCQEMKLRIESYAYKTDDILFQWKDYNPVSISDNLPSSLFSVEGFDTVADKVKVSTGEYSYLNLQITIVRRLNYYLCQVFIPCNMLVIAAYLGFWLDIKFITGRVILSVSTLYTCATMITNLNLQLPKAPYTKLIDVYTGICLTFVFATLVELVVAQAYENCRCRNVSSEDPEQNAQVKTFNVIHIKQWLKSTPINKVDAIFRIMYPIAFVAFLILYCIAVFV